METLQKAQIAGIVTLVMIIGGAVIVENISSSYYCSPEDNVKECFKLGANNSRCYYNTLAPTKYDLCVNGKFA